MRERRGIAKQQPFYSMWVVFPSARRVWRKPAIRCLVACGFSHKLGGSLIFLKSIIFKIKDLLCFRQLAQRVH